MSQSTLMRFFKHKRNLSESESDKVPINKSNERDDFCKKLCLSSNFISEEKKEIDRDSDCVATTSSTSEPTLSIWSDHQRKYFLEQYGWLKITNFNTVGCKICAQFTSLNVQAGKSLHISAEWKNSEVSPNGSTKVSQQASMRKKLKKHATSESHCQLLKILEVSKRNQIAIAVDNANEKHLDSTIRLFNTVYSLVKRNRPMNDISAEVELQRINGVDLGISLHSRQTAMHIAKHISHEIRCKIFKNIIDQKSKICIILDEASTISKKSALAIFIRCSIENVEEPAMFFVDLRELSCTISETIFDTLLSTLQEYGFTETFLRENLISFCSDGASNMLGRKSGVAARLLEKFPGIIIWHCLSHRVQLALDDAIAAINQVNHFKYFLEKIYTFYHTSNKNQTELHNIAGNLEIEILKIGRVLGPRWVACSTRATKAVWQAYPALHEHFSQSGQLGMKTKMEKLSFIQDLALMIDILEELSLLSLALQSRDVNILKADRLIKRSIRALYNLKSDKGKYEQLVPEIIESAAYKNISFNVNQSKISNASLPRNQLIQAIIDNMTRRLLNKDIEYYSNLFGLLSPKEDIISPWQEGEAKLEELNKVLKINITLNDFRDFIDCRDLPSSDVPNSVKEAKKIMKVIAVSSAEVERGFSLMSNIATEKRNTLSVENISHLMTINLLGKPLINWDAVPFVKSWLTKGHHTADNTRVRKHVEPQYSQNQMTIWSIL